MKRRRKLENGNAVNMMFNIPAFREFYDEANPEEVYQLMGMLLEYYEDGIMPEMNTVSSMHLLRTFFRMAEYIDSGVESYRKTCDTRREAYQKRTENTEAENKPPNKAMNMNKISTTENANNQQYYHKETIEEKLIGF